MEEFSGATSISVEQEFWLNLLLSNISALLKRSADDIIKQNDKKKTNKYRYQANRAYIIARIKWFLPRFFSGCRSIDLLLEIFDDACVVLSQIQPNRKNPRKIKRSADERKHFNNRKRVL